MVATLLRLRLLILKNTLMRNKWQLVAVIFGGLYGLGALAGATAGLIALSFAPVDLAQTIVVLAGSALVLGWVLIPLLTSGIDQTLDTSKLSRFPLTRTTLLIGLTLAGVIGIPGIVTLLASLATATTWWRDPLIAIVALICAVLGTLTCVVGSRMTVGLTASLGANRRYRELTAVLLFVPLILIGPAITGITSAAEDTGLQWPRLADALSWTPLGAAWAVPSELALGHPLIALAKFGIAVASIAVFVVVWRRTLRSALETPARATTKSRGAGHIGLLGMIPATPTWAVAARSLTYWARDPRYTAQLILVPLLPVILIVNGQITDLPVLVLGSAPLVAFILSLAIYTDISYDNTAFATHLATGVSGRADRAGRVIALASFALPLITIIATASVAFADAWDALPAVLGLSLGLVLSGMGISSVTSARFVMPVPLPGDSPLKAKPGAQISAILTSLLAWAILSVLVLPEFVMMIVFAITGNQAFGWAGLVLGLGLGSLFAALGIRIGGRMLDRTGPTLMAALVRQR